MRLIAFCLEYLFYKGQSVFVELGINNLCNSKERILFSGMNEKHSCKKSLES